MKPPIFDYVIAESQEHALEVLREHGDDAKVLAGGQSLVPLMSFRLAKPSVLLDINRLEGLDSIEASGGRMRIGALTRQCELLSHPLISEYCPLMRAATEFIGHPAIRNRGTVGGSVAHADPAAELPILLQVLDAEIEVCSTGSRRSVPVGRLLHGPAHDLPWRPTNCSPGSASRRPGRMRAGASTRWRAATGTSPWWRLLR